MKNKIQDMKKLVMLICLPLLVVGCSKDDEEVKPFNSSEDPLNYVSFQGNMVSMTRSKVDEANVDTACLYAWQDSSTIVGSHTIINRRFLPETVYSYTDLLYYKESDFLPDYAVMTRRQDDPTLWDYDRKLLWKDYPGRKLSFMAVCGPKENVYLHLSHILVRNVPHSEYDAINHEYYYMSGDLSDAMVAYAYDCTAAEYEGKKAVTLNFNHVFPRISLNAKLGENNALDVEISEAYIFGLALNGSHRMEPGNSLNEGWRSSTNSMAQYIQMNLSQPVKLTSDYTLLVDPGQEPHVLPQNVKAWRSFTALDGAGIILSAKIRNINDNSWIVGNNTEYDLVFAPFPLEKLEMGRSYDVNLVFGTQYRANGAAYGYHLSYTPQIKDWDTESEDIELVRK